jgi:cation transport regulator
VLDPLPPGYEEGSRLLSRKGGEMPYDNLSDLPDSVRNNLPKHAQEIYKEAYNSAESSTARRTAPTAWRGAPSKRSIRRTRRATGSRRAADTSP